MKPQNPFQFTITTLLVAAVLFALLCSSWRMGPEYGVPATLATCLGVAGLWDRLLAVARHGDSLTRREKLKHLTRPAAIVFLALLGIIFISWGVFKLLPMLLQ